MNRDPGIPGQKPYCPPVSCSRQVLHSSPDGILSAADGRLSPLPPSEGAVHITPAKGSGDQRPCGARASLRRISCVTSAAGPKRLRCGELRNKRPANATASSSRKCKPVPDQNRTCSSKLVTNESYANWGSKAVRDGPKLAKTVRDGPRRPEAGQDGKKRPWRLKDLRYGLKWSTERDQ